MNNDNLERARRANAISNLDQTLKEVLIIRNNMAKDVPGGKMVVLKEVTREEYDLSGQNPLVNFRAAVKEVLKVKGEEEEEQQGEDNATNHLIPFFKVDEGKEGLIPIKTKWQGVIPKQAIEDLIVSEEEVDTIPYFSEDLPGKAPPCKFTVKQVKKELQEYCDTFDIPTGKRGVFKAYMPFFQRSTHRHELAARINSTHNMLKSTGVL